MGTIRAFVALYPDEEAGRAIVAFRDRMRRAAPREGFRWAKDDQLHLTLRFMGELPEESVEDLAGRLAASCARFPAFRVEAKFDGEPWRGARVVALAVSPESRPLADLQQAVERDVRTVGLPPEPKAFHPHLTLARIDHPRLQPKAPAQIVAEWAAAELVMVKSVLGDRGAAHETLARFPLQ